MSNLLQRMENHPHVRVKDIGDGIVACNFTQKAFQKNYWDIDTCAARGLFIDTETGKIVARGYEKFFGLGEWNGQTVEDYVEQAALPVTVAEKGNGYLGIIAVVKNKLAFYSKGGITPHSEHAKKFFYENTTEAQRYSLKNNLKFSNESLLVEMIDPDSDPHIIAYDRPMIMLLDVVKNEEAFKIPYAISSRAVKGATPRTILRADNEASVFVTPFSLTVDSKDELRKVIQLAEQNTVREGFVFRDVNGHMTKVKSAHYKYVKSYRGALRRVMSGKPDPRGDVVVERLADDGKSLEDFMVTNVIGGKVLNLPALVPYM